MTFLGIMLGGGGEREKERESVLIFPCEIHVWYRIFILHIIIIFVDSRVEKWLLMESPVPILTIFVLYLLLVKQGPRWMEQYKPLQLQGWLVIYNLALVGLSVYMFEEVGYIAETCVIMGGCIKQERGYRKYKKYYDNHTCTS